MMLHSDSPALDVDDRERHHIRQTIADEIREQTDRLTAEHAAKGSRLLRVYRSKSPRPPRWIEPDSALRRWIGSPLTLFGLLSATVAACVEGLNTIVPSEWAGRYVIGMILILVVRLLYLRFSGRAANRIIDVRERAQALAETASDCIAVGTTHVSYRISGTFLDRSRSYPLAKVSLTTRPTGILLAKPDGTPIAQIDDPWCEIVGRGPTRAAPMPLRGPQAPTFGQRR